MKQNFSKLSEKKLKAKHYGDIFRISSQSCKTFQPFYTNTPKLKKLPPARD